MHPAMRGIRRMMSPDQRASYDRSRRAARLRNKKPGMREQKAALEVLQRAGLSFQSIKDPRERFSSMFSVRGKHMTYRPAVMIIAAMPEASYLGRSVVKLYKAKDAAAKKVAKKKRPRS